MKNATFENIQAIIFGVLRGESQSSIGERLGLHRQTVKKIMDSPEFQSTVDTLEALFMGGMLTKERQQKNAIILKAYQMSHPYREDVLKTARQIAYEKYSEPGNHIGIEAEDIENFCKDFNIDF